MKGHENDYGVLVVFRKEVCVVSIIVSIGVSTGMQEPCYSLLLPEA